MATVLVIGAGRPESLESSYVRAFRSAGWATERWDPARALETHVRGGRAGAMAARFIHVEPWARKANVELLQAIDRMHPDLVLVIATSGVRAGTLAQAKVVSPRTRIYMLYPDSPHGLDGDRINCLRFCDRVTVSTPAWVEPFRKLGAERVHYLPFAADTGLYAAARAADATPRWEVGFVGTWRPEREAVLEGFKEFALAVWGGGYWKARSNPHGTVRARWTGHEAVGSAMAGACAQTAVMLNILDPITWPGPNMRSFELPACRAFVLSQRSPAILELFREGEDIECFDSLDEARDKVRHYIARPEERRRIAANAYDRVVLGGHTYDDRVTTLLAWLAEDR